MIGCGGLNTLRSNLRDLVTQSVDFSLRLGDAIVEVCQLVGVLATLLLAPVSMSNIILLFLPQDLHRLINHGNDFVKKPWECSSNARPSRFRGCFVPATCCIMMQEVHCDCITVRFKSIRVRGHWDSFNLPSSLHRSCCS